MFEFAHLTFSPHQTLQQPQPQRPVKRRRPVICSRSSNPALVRASPAPRMASSAILTTVPSFTGARRAPVSTLPAVRARTLTSGTASATGKHRFIHPVVSRPRHRRRNRLRRPLHNKDHHLLLLFRSSSRSSSPFRSQKSNNRKL